MTFRQKLDAAVRIRNSLLCVGLDPDPASLDGRAVDDFLYAIIEATQDLACAYKPNLAFFEALGPEGLSLLQRVLRRVPPDLPVIGDAKRGDIGNTAAKYAQALFDIYGFDAVTVNPYLGGDALEPFLERADRGVIVVCRTSNPGARDFQDLPVNGTPLYEVVARQARDAWNGRGNVGLVVGATYPEEARRLRALCPEMPFLVPGIGAQAGDLEAAVRASVDTAGGGALINISRGVLYAGRGEGFAGAARAAAQGYRERINAARSPRAG